MLIGIDGGASKTALVLCAKDGAVLAHVQGGGTNPNDIGFETACTRLREQMTALLAAQQGMDTALDAVFAGLSGGGAPAHVEGFQAFFRQMLPHAATLGNDSDMINLLNCGVQSGDGMVAIAGTGTSLMVRAKGERRQVGGWGYLLDDAGGGFDIGRHGFNAVLRAADGRGPATALTARYTDRLGATVQKSIARIYEGGKHFIASFAVDVFAAAEAGDAEAQAIVQHAVKELSLLLASGAKSLEKPPYRAVLGGSLWRSPMIMQGVRALLGEDFALIQTDLPPVFGAVVEAAVRAGIPCGAEFEAAFRLTLPSIPMITV